MRRSALLVSALLLSGCTGSGYWRYLEDTATLPGANPNRPSGTSETYWAVRHGSSHGTEAAPLLTEAGDVWPGQPQPVPTLRDLQKQQNAELGSAGIGSLGGVGSAGALKPLPPLPQLPGYEISPPLPTNPAPAQEFPGGRVKLPSGQTQPFTNPQNYQTVPGGEGRESIVVPNGNGTSTVIGPNGEVSTIPTPGK